MKARMTLRRSLSLSIAIAAAFAAYGLMSPAEAQAGHGDSRVGYRSGATRVAKQSRTRHSSHNSHNSRSRHCSPSRYSNFHYDSVYHPEYYHYTPDRGIHSHGHYDLVPHYNRHYGGHHGGHHGSRHGSGIHFSFGF